MNSPYTVLAIGAHPDDIELGCGGSLAKLASRGARVHALSLTHGAEGAVAGVNRCAESDAALTALGACEVTHCDFADTQLSASFAQMVRVLEQALARLAPHRVYTMYREDRHQDHRTVFDASIIACRTVPQVLCYETPSAWQTFAPQLYEDISGFLDRRIDALRMHESQRGRRYMQEDQVRCLAHFRGHQVSAGPSEAFIAHRMVL